MSKEVLSEAKLLDFYEQIPRKKNFQESLSNFKTRLLARGYPKNLVERILSEVSFAGRQSALKQKKKNHQQILPFVTTYHPGVKNLKIYIDAQMEFNSKSAIAEDHFQKASYYIIQQRQITQRHARQSKAGKALKAQ